MTGRTLGENLGRISFWTILIGLNVAFLPLILAGFQGQVVDVYKFYAGTGVSADNLVATIGSFVLALGVVLELTNVVLSLRTGVPAGHDPWGGTSLEWLAESPPPAHNFDLLPDVRGPEPLRDFRDAIARQQGDGGERAAETQPVG